MSMQATLLGVTGTAQKTLLRNLHMQSIKSLTQIIKVRRHAERRVKHKQQKTYYRQANPGKRMKKPPDPT